MGRVLRPVRQQNGWLRRTARLTLGLWAGVTVIGAGWALSQNPFAQPFVERSAHAVRIELDRAMASVATPQWIDENLNAAVETRDHDRIGMYLDLAKERNIDLSDDLRQRAQAARDMGAWEKIGGCLPCAFDIAECPTAYHIGACFLPVQISPIGDVMALGEEGMAYAAGAEVDELNAGLAALGLTATVVTVATVGAALPAKIGLTTLRVAKKADALNPAMIRTLRGTKTAEDVMQIAGDTARIVGKTSPVAALSIVKAADNATELNRLARLSEIAGPKTTRALDVLGKGRALRIMHRLSDIAIVAFGLVMALVAQTGALIGAGIKLAIRHAAR